MCSDTGIKETKRKKELKGKAITFKNPEGRLFDLRSAAGSRVSDRT